MRVNIMPGDMLVAHTGHLGDHGIKRALIEIKKGDTLLVISCVAEPPKTTDIVYVEDADIHEDHYPDKYYVQALWRDLLIETIVYTDNPFCNVVRKAA